MLCGARGPRMSRMNGKDNRTICRRLESIAHLALRLRRALGQRSRSIQAGGNAPLPITVPAAANLSDIAAPRCRYGLKVTLPAQSLLLLLLPRAALPLLLLPPQHLLLPLLLQLLCLSAEAQLLLLTLRCRESTSPIACSSSWWQR